jgi:uncharacterized membrane protein (UPF0127 family)
MRALRVIRLKDQAVIADQCFEAVRFLDRFRGLMGRAGLGAGEAMVFPNCSSIHTCWMRFSIDVVFLRRSEGRKDVWSVSSVRAEVRPWNLWVRDGRAERTLELKSGSAAKIGLIPGDEVECIG